MKRSDDFDAFTARVKDQVDFIDQMAAKAQAKDPSGLQELQQEIDKPTLKPKTQAAARKAGLTGCAKP